MPKCNFKAAVKETHHLKRFLQNITGAAGTRMCPEDLRHVTSTDFVVKENLYKHH